MSKPFLIAGGGIAGLAAALGLARGGRDIRLFEQAAAFEEVGAGLQMSPNGVRALQELGAWDAVDPACVIPTEIHVRDGLTGRLLQRIRLGKGFETSFGAPYRVCHRADLLEGLVQTARGRTGIVLETGRRVQSVESKVDGTALHLDGETVKGAAVICADGIRSGLRKVVCGDVAPVDRGHVIFRSLIPLADVPSSIETDCVSLWLYPGGHAVHYAVSGWRSFNIVVALDSDGIAASGWSDAADGSTVRHAFLDADDVLQDLLTRPAAWMRWRGADLPGLSLWNKDNIVLTGDAAHATLPYLAQGAVMALEDAAVLGRETSMHARPAEAFAAFTQLRKPRTARLQLESRKLGAIYHARGLKSLLRNAALSVLGPDAALNRNRWIYDWRP
jgi:salicylate hydroxylase